MEDIAVGRAGDSRGKGLLLMLTLIVFFPSQFVAHSPDLDQTVTDRYCKLQNLFQHAQHASPVCFTQICRISAGGCLTQVCTSLILD